MDEYCLLTCSSCFAQFTFLYNQDYLARVGATHNGLGTP